MKHFIILAFLLACEPSPYHAIALCGEDAAVDSPPDACTANPTPNAVFTDTTGQGHPTITLLAPANYSSSPCVSRPLLVYMNGYGGDGGSIVARFLHTGIQDTFETNGALVLTPSGIVGSTGKRRWNASPACCEPVQPANDDVFYLSDLVDRVIAAGWNVDPKRVYALGMSNGGIMAVRLACNRPDRWTGVVAIAAFGMSGGVACESISSYGGPVHIALSHSKADSTLLYNGGTMNLPPLMPAAYPKIEGAGGTIEQLSTRNGCTGSLNLLETYAYDFDHATGYPAGVMDTDSLEVGSCPTDGSIELWRAPYPAAPGGATYGHSIHTTTEFGDVVRAWLSSHVRM